MAIHDDSDLAVEAAIAAAPSVSPSVAVGDVTITPAACSPGAQVEFQIDYDLSLMTGLFGINLPISGVGVMQCGG